MGSAKKKAQMFVKLVSAAGTGFFYVKRKPRQFTEKLEFRKRGLSKYYKGKSKTFRSLSDCKCLEDLSKKEIALKKKAHSSFHSPKADISKKAGRSCFTSLLYKLN
ncbi:50S ribosomal protein L33 [Trifolium repens]|nr:50S ribosomal protein L33 [Trifolium repens]